MRFWAARRLRHLWQINRSSPLSDRSKQNSYLEPKSSAPQIAQTQFCLPMSCPRRRRSSLSRSVTRKNLSLSSHFCFRILRFTQRLQLAHLPSGVIFDLQNRLSGSSFSHVLHFLVSVFTVPPVISLAKYSKPL